MLPAGRPGVIPQHMLVPVGYDCYIGHSLVKFLEMTNASQQVQSSITWLSEITNATACTGVNYVCSSAAVNKNFSSSYHEYGVEWSESKISFFLDALPYMTCYPMVPDPSVSVLARDMFLILTTQLGMDISIATPLPQFQKISSVKIMQREEDAARTFRRLSEKQSVLFTL